MAVVSTGEIWERRRSSYRNGILSHYLMYLVQCDDIHDGTAAAISASGVPSPGDAYVDPSGNVAYLNGIDCDPRNGSDRVFEIQIQFDTLDPSQPDDNPLHQPATFAWSHEESTEPYFVDESTNGPNGGGAIVVNTAGDPFETLPTRDRSTLVITMGVNSATHDPVAADLLSNTTNQDDITLDDTTYAAGTLRLKPISATKNQKTLRTGQVVNYYAKTLTFVASHQGWHDHPLNVGFSELVGSRTTNTQTLRRIVDGNGMPVTKPWPLDPSGAKLTKPWPISPSGSMPLSSSSVSPSGTILPYSTIPPLVLDFQPYRDADWTNVIIV